MRRRDYIILKKIIEEIDVASGMIGESSLDQFLADEKLKRAVSMTIINIGELIKNITDEMRSNHEEVPLWQ